MRKCDVLIIGGGPGGYVAAIKAAQLGKNVTLIEKEHLGGTCLNWGCIPMKALIRNAEVIDMLNNGDTFGFEIDSFKADYSKAYARSREVSNRLSQGIKYLMKKNGVEVIFDEAVVQKDRTVHLKNADKDLQAENIIIAAGAQPARLHIFDYTDPHVLDSRRALALDTAPKSVCIIGGGAIGLEFASVWNAYGAKVTIIEMMDRLLPQEDEAVSSAVLEAYARNGIEVLTHTTVTGTKSAKNKIVVSTNETDLECEYVLVSVGIKPNSCFDDSGITTDQRGYVIVDDSMRTNIEGVYAIGDITGKLPLAHTASAQGIVAAKAISSLERHLLNYD